MNKTNYGLLKDVQISIQLKISSLQETERLLDEIIYNDLLYSMSGWNDMIAKVKLKNAIKSINKIKGIDIAKIEEEVICAKFSKEFIEKSTI